MGREHLVPGARGATYVALYVTTGYLVRSAALTGPGLGANDPARRGLRSPAARLLRAYNWWVLFLVLTRDVQPRLGIT